MMTLAKFFLLTVCIPGIFLAQYAGAAEFRVLGLSRVPGQETLEYVGATGPVEVPVSLALLSEDHRIPEGGVLDFYDKAPADGEQKKPLFRVDFSGYNGDVILLLKADEGSGNYRYKLIDDSRGAFPEGSAYILNFMREPVVVKLGAKIVQIGSGGSELIPLAQSANKPFNDGVKFATVINGEMQVFSINSWYLLPSMKIFCMIFPDANGIPQIRRIRTM